VLDAGIDDVRVPDPHGIDGDGRGQRAVGPDLLGVATYGTIQRPDVAALYGAQFQSSGYVFNINRAAAGLSNGTHNIVVWVHSSVTNSFTTYAVLRVTLQ
jgi:hypothetical protein